MIASNFNKDIFEVLTIFSMSPGSRFSRKELKEKTRLNNVNLDNALNSLINADIIKKERKYFSFNLEGNKEIITLVSKEYKKLKEIPLDSYFSVINIIFLLNKFRKISVYLFGSYAKLVFREGSDIDIAVISNSINDKGRKKINEGAQKIERKYGKRIEVHYFGMNFYKNRKDPLVKEIIKNGVKLI